jgi:hypothetical protein
MLIGERLTSIWRYASNRKVADSSPDEVIAILIYLILPAKNSNSSLETWECGRRDPLRWLRGTFHQQNLALTSPTNGGLSVGIVCLRTEATELLILPAALGHGVCSVSNRNEYQESSGGLKRGQRLRLTTSPPSASRSSWECGILDILQLYRPARPLTWVAVIFFLFHVHLDSVQNLLSSCLVSKNL